MTKTEAGKTMHQAVKAVADMHADTSILLRDLDKLFKKRKSIFKNIVTGELTYNVEALMWMAAGVFRYWDLRNGNVAGVTVMFYDHDVDIGEPLLVVGCLHYKAGKDGAQKWDLWHMAADKERRKKGRGIDVSMADEFEGRIEKASYAIRPLYSITSTDDVKAMFSECGVDL